MKVLLLAVVLTGAALAQVSAFGTIGAVRSKSGAKFGGGASYTVKRLSFGAEAIGRDAVIGTGAIRIWKGFYAEGGFGGMATSRTVVTLTEGQAEPIRACYSAKCPILGWTDPGFIETRIAENWWRPMSSAGAYYQTPGRVFFRAGYRRLFVRGDHDTDQAYTAVGITF